MQWDGCIVLGIGYLELNAGYLVVSAGYLVQVSRCLFGGCWLSEVVRGVKRLRGVGWLEEDFGYLVMGVGCDGCDVSGGCFEVGVLGI